MEIYKHLYQEMNRSGELFEIFDNMTGKWSVDKHFFIEQQEALESLGEQTDYYDGE